MFDDIVLPIIRDRIASRLNQTGLTVRCHIDETVWPNKGDRWIGVYPNTTNAPPVNSEEAESNICGFNVGITIRCGDTPEDRLFSFAYGSKGIVPLFRAVVAMMRQDRWVLQELINNALDLTPNLSEWKLVEPYRFQGGDVPVIKKGPEHFHAEQITETRPYYGLFTSGSWSQGLYMASLLNEEVVF